APRAGSGEPLDLADPLRPHPAAPGPPYRRGSPAALGTPPQARDAYPRTRPPRFWPPGRPRRHAGQPAKTLPGRPRPTQRTHQHPRTQASRAEEGRLTSRYGLKRKLSVVTGFVHVVWRVAVTAGGHRDTVGSV